MSFPILCYHKVGPSAVNGRWLNVEAQTLNSHVRFFKRRGYKFCRARDLAFGGLPSRGVCFTFDDCYTSAIEYGFPVFEDHDVKASFYAVSGLIGTASTWDGARAAPLCGWDALKRLHDSGHEVGNHTTTHKALGELSEEAQANDLIAAHQELTARGIKPESVAYPYGSMNASTKQALVTAGYQIGLAVEKRLAETTDDRRALPRVVVAYSDALPMLIYRLFIRPGLRRKVI